ncbi:MAG: hypothetical protein IPI32_07230 [Austwickia sp.]|nr:hypothetical protein [Austwickia sp.]MBK8437158.1 hypothetical protein [Austwickia sp.]MBK9102392.1 hypothetical protein [Austwickia sp.]
MPPTPDLAWELERTRSTYPLPDVPVALVAATRTTWTPWDRRWVRRQRGLAARLAQDHPRGSAGVTLEVLQPCGHLVMRHRPEAVVAALARLASQTSTA